MTVGVATLLLLHAAPFALDHLALGANGALGLGGKLPWSHPEDREHFEHTTRGHAVIMGRRTWEEEGRPLDERLGVAASLQPLRAGATQPTDRVRSGPSSAF